MPSHQIHSPSAASTSMVAHRPSSGGGERRLRHLAHLRDKLHRAPPLRGCRGVRLCRPVWGKQEHSVASFRVLPHNSCVFSAPSVYSAFLPSPRPSGRPRGVG